MVGSVALGAGLVVGTVPAAASVAGATTRARAAAAPATTPHGDATTSTSAPPEPTSASPVVGLSADPAVSGGYWVAAANGGVFAFGVPFFGSAGALALNQPIVAMAATPDGRGYWLVAADGGIFNYGDAVFYGSTGGMALNQPIVGMTSTPDGRGYWLVAADGGLFAYGDAAFYGSTGGMALNRPVVGMAATADGRGYWLVASDGGIFAFGDAAFAGSTGDTPLARPVVGMAAAPGGGYWLVAADGGLFAFGGAPFHGSTGGMTLGRAVVGMAPVPAGGGYWLVGGDGGVYAFGAADFAGAVHVLPLAGLTVAFDPGHDGGNGGAPQVIDQPIFNGLTTEPCDTAGSSTDNGYTEHAFNFDVATRAAALLEEDGADVVLTRPDDTGVGPCVDVRAAIGNNAHAAAAVSIHADGGPPGGRGFTVTTPAPVVSSISNNTAIVAPSDVLGTDLRDAFGTDTGEPTSTYDGVDGLIARSDLGGLNLSTVPKVLIECANMRNATDAALVQTAGWRQRAAQGIVDGITAFLVAGQQT